LPEPRFRFFGTKSSSRPLFVDESAACFFNNALRVVSFRALSSSSESDESEPDRLSSRSRSR
jgi:hypothetical protein